MLRANFPHRRLKRQEEAKTRQEAASKLTLEQKLAKSVPGSKEYIRLSIRKAKESEK